MKNLESFESAAASIGVDPLVLPIVDGMPEKYRQAIISGFKLDIISEASWEGVPIDWDNYNQRKYYPWWDMRTGSGVGLRFVGYVFGLGCSHVGSRRVFPTREIAEYVAGQHFQLYVDTLIIK